MSWLAPLALAQRALRRLLALGPLVQAFVGLCQTLDGAVDGRLADGSVDGLSTAQPVYGCLANAPRSFRLSSVCTLSVLGTMRCVR